MAVGGVVAQFASSCGRALCPRRGTSRGTRYGTGAAVFADRCGDGRPRAESGDNPAHPVAARIRNPRT